jgi:hypothetical protein
LLIDTGIGDGFIYWDVFVLLSSSRPNTRKTAVMETKQRDQMDIESDFIEAQGTVLSLANMVSVLGDDD